MPHLCAFGCKPGDDVSMHCFPNPEKFPERFRTWVTLVGGKLETASDYEYYKRKKICSKHFTDRDRNRNNRLNALAIPTLHLPGQSTSQVIMEQASTSTGHRTLQAANIDQSASQAIVEQASISTGHTTSQAANIGQSPIQVILEEASASTSSRYTTLPPPDKDIYPEAPALSRVVLEHNYAVTSKPRKLFRKDKSKMKPAYCLVQPLRTKISSLRKEISRLRKKGQSFHTRLANAEKVNGSAAFQHIVKHMTTPAKLFVHMQQQTSKKPKGRRFTIEEKVLSLSLYKKSPKCYALLHKYFTLPSAKSMKRLLSQIKLYPGINPIIFNKIKKTILGKDVSDRLCSLIFDEMSLTPQVNYNAQRDLLEGFANTKDHKFADHALVFMVKGVKHNFKQPVAYYFTAGLNKLELKTLIKTVVKHTQDSGLIILNTVCDQSTVNVGAITDLVNETKETYLRQKKEWRHDFMRINKQNIIPIFDAPHLIKGIRNNLLTKDLIYTFKGEEKIVKWQYYQQLYAADKSYGELRLVNKLTEEHVNPQKINKMRVKSATQLFSRSVAAATEHLTARGDLPEECRQLIDVTLLLDNLFDSLNVSSYQKNNAKEYKGPIRRHSPHHALWKEAKAVLKTMKFRQLKKVGNKMRLVESAVPSVLNFIKTIEGMEAIWKVLSEKYGFDAFLTRNLNQDPAENFFGNIRSYGARNNSPNTVAFEGAFKALLLNNYNSPHSSKANCEEDSNKCLQTLEFFLTEKPDAPDVPNEDKVHCNSEVFSFDSVRDSDAGQRNYVCGWVLTKCLKNIVKSCQVCRKNLIDTDNHNTRNDFIKAKEYNKKRWLCYPSTKLEDCFRDLQNITESFLTKDVQKNNIKKNIISIADLLIDFPFDCSVHQINLRKYFTDVSVNVMLYSWCRTINRILSGKLTYNGQDQTKTAAQQYYNKHKHYKNKK